MLSSESWNSAHFLNLQERFENNRFSLQYSEETDYPMFGTHSHSDRPRKSSFDTTAEEPTFRGSAYLPLTPSPFTLTL